MPGSPADDPSAEAISEAVSRLFLDKFGKGPIDVRTLINGDVAVTLMRDVFTVAERTMIAEGNSDSVLTTRMLWQQATREMFKAAISKAAGREVVSVVSGFELDQEMASEVFVFAPAG